MGRGRRLNAAAFPLLAAITVAVALAASLTPASTQADQRAWKQPVQNVSVSPGVSPGELHVGWDAHPESPTEYRVKWTPEGEDFKRRTETDWVAFPTDPELVITDLTPGETYEVIVRAVFGPRKSAWSDVETGAAAEAVPEPPQIVETPITEPAPLVAEQQFQEPDYAADRFYALGIDIHSNFTRYFTYDDSVDVDDDPRDYFSFWLDESTEVNLSLRQLDFDADLFLEDEYGNVLASSENKGIANEDINATLPDEFETYYIRIESLEAGANNYRFKAKVSDPDPATEVTVPEVTGPPVVYIPPPEPVAEPVDDSVAMRADTCTDNNSTTCTATINGTFNGTIEAASDFDRIKVVLEANKSYVFEMLGSMTGRGTLRRTQIEGIYNQSGTLQSDTTDEGGATSASSAYANQARVRFKPSSAGNYYVRLGSWGTGNVDARGTFRFNVKRDDELGSASTTAFVNVGSSASGRIEERHDKDWFRVALQASKTYQIDVKGKSTGHGSVWDIEIEGIYDPSGSRRFGGNDDGGQGRNARKTITTGSTGAGSYYVAVSNNLYTSTPHGTYKVFVTDITNGHPDDYSASTSTAATVAVNGTAEGNIQYQDDEDWFKVTLTAGTKYWIEMNSYRLREGGGGVRAFRGLEDAYIRGIQNSSGHFISNATSNDNGGFYLNSRVIFFPSYTGIHYIIAGSAQDPDGFYAEGSYQIEVTTCIPPSCLRGAMSGRTAMSGPRLAPQIQGPPVLAVADAEVREAANAELAFAVTLSRPPLSTVTVDYATSDGTATAGSDYTAASGTVTFAAGETEKTVSVAVLDDAHDEGSETLTLTLSNASGAYLKDGTATGTINNSDHMPKAWMVRFGRTVGSQVVDALGQRFEGATASHVTVGGIPLTGAPGAVPEAESDDPFGLPDWATRAQSEASVQSLTANDLLLRSAFHLSSGGGQGAGTAYTAWGRVATSGFAAEVDDVTMDADVTSRLVGFDAEWARILAGVMFSHSTGEGDYRLSAEGGGRAGRVESSLTGVYPYARVALNARVSAWALAGAASGELTLKQEGGDPMPAGIVMRMGAVGFKGRVLDGTGASGVGLDVKTDALWVGTKSEDTGELAPTEGDVTRLRVTLAGERAFGADEGARLTPSAEVGVRHDGGDAETGTGLEVGAGLSYVAGALTVEGQVRTLVAHAESGYEEWGMSGAIRITPRPSGRGLTLSIAPEWGRTGSATERLWSARDASGLGADRVFEGDSRLAVDAGYGLGLGRGVLTPYAGLVLGDAGSRTVRTGARWQVGADAVLGLEGTRQTSDAGESGNELMLRVALRF